MLREDPAVDAAESNHVRRSSELPDDPLLAKGRQGWVRTLRLSQAWDLAKATRSLVVAVVDTGVDADHPDLAGRVLPGRDVVNRDSEALDDEGHGTAVASIVAARAADGIGIAGVAWDASVLPVKVLDSSGAGTDATVAEGITWAADQGADVINMSLGGPGRSSLVDEAVAYARARGSVLVAAAGNDGGPFPSYPAASPGVLAVGATDWSGTLAWYSSTGGFVDLTAPGHRMRAARPADDGLGGWRDGDGTSFASPVVAGVALLVLAQNPTWTPEQVEQRLLTTALDAGAEGVDPYYGRGLVDPVAALGGTPLPAVAAPPGDGDDAMNRARVLSAGSVTPVTGTLAREGDADWYALDVSGGIEAAVSLQTATGTGFRDDRAQVSDGVIDVFSPARDLVGTIDQPGLERAEFASLGLWGTGRWWFRVSNYVSSRGHEPYSFSVRTGSLQGWTEPTFTQPRPVPREGNAVATALADVTGDGRPEALLTTRDGAGTQDDYRLVVHPFDAEGEPGELQSLDTGARIQYSGEGGRLSSTTMGVTTGDFNGDGRSDAAVAAGRWLGVFPQRDGRLAPVEPVPDSAGADLVEAGDLDADGRLDLVALMDRDSSSSVVAFLRRPGGWQRTPVTSTGGSSLALGDVDGNGRLDVVAATSHAIVLTRQRPDGSFAPSEVVHDDTGGGVAVADVTGDGRDDVITTSNHSGDGQNTLDLRAQTTTGTLAPPVSQPIFYPGEAVRTGDIDGDGRRDVVVAEEGSDSAGVFHGRGDGSLGPEQRVGLMTYTSDYPPGALALGDVTRDGATDLVVADHNHGLVAVRRRSAGFPRRPWLVETTPSEGQAGVSSTVAPVVRFGRALDPASVTASAVRLQDRRGTQVAASLSYDTTGRALTVRPAAALAPGGWTLRMGGLRDSVGGQAPEQLALTFTVGAATTADAVAPDTEIRLGPVGTTRKQDFTRFAYDGSEPGVTFQCSLDGAAFAACPADHLLTSALSQGTHTFRARAVDAAGRVDGTPSARTWTVRPTLTPPANDAFSSPQELTGSSGTVSGSSIGAEHDSLPGQLSLTAHDQGEHSIWFRWTAPTTGTVTWDTAGSDFDTILGVFSGDPAAGTLRRRAEDDDVPGGRTSRARLAVRAGETLRIGVDGTADPMYAPSGAVRLTWAFSSEHDGTAPETTITGGPPPLETTGKATFTFSSSEPGSSFSCSHDEEAWQPCASPRTLSFPNGEHVLRVRATDAAGNSDASPATWSWRSDALPPETRFSSQPRAATTGRTASFSFAAEEPASYECRLDRGPWAPCTSPHEITGVALGPHEMDVRATDEAGHVESEPERASWRVLPADPLHPDFNGDGFADLAVGVAGEDVGTVPDAGAVNVLYGGTAGAATASNQLWHQNSSGVADTAEGGDGFGAAVTTADLDGDGFTDLVVGVAGEDVGTVADGGVVHVLYGSAGGLTATGSQLWHQDRSSVADALQAGDGFGAALTAGDLNGDRIADLVVGVPGEDLGEASDAGAVHVLPGSPAGLSTTGSQLWHQDSSGVVDSPESGDGFGAALATADLDRDALVDLVIGVAAEDIGTVTDAGVLHVLPGSASGPTSAASQYWQQNSSGIADTAERGDGFAAALGTGDLNRDGFADLVVGVPREDLGTVADAGVAHVLHGSASGASATGSQYWHQNSSGVTDSVEAGDGFGAAVSTADLNGDRFDDLALGASGEDLGTTADGGVVHVLHGSAAGVSATGSQYWHQDRSSIADTLEAGDRFGAALSASDLDGDLFADLLLAVPGEDVGAVADAGALHVLRGGSAGLDAFGSQLWHQNSSGVLDSVEEGDGFGAFVR